MRLPSILLLGFAMSAFGGAGSADYHNVFGPFTSPAPTTQLSPRHGPREGIDAVRRWNEIAINASGLDHTPVAPGENRVFGEQLGPCRAARAMAIVHIAMFDAVNALVGEYESYTGVRAPAGPMSLYAAAGQAAHDTLAALFPSQAPKFDTALNHDLGLLNNDKAKANGIQLGKTAAAGTLALRANDGSQHTEPRLNVDFFTSND
ncbi:MAG: chloroperoxidase, partial [Chthoniobacterales bacterium]